MNMINPCLEILPDTLLATRVEQRLSPRVPSAQTGRLAYGGLAPGMVGCRIVDLSAAGVRVETYARLKDAPEIFTLEFGGDYYRARRIWMNGTELGLAFMADEGGF